MIDADPQGSMSISLGCDEPDRLDYSLATALVNIINDEPVDVSKGIIRNAHELLQKYPSSKVTAIDYSDVSVAKAAAYNTDMIHKGRCKVQQGDVSNLNMNGQYDLATAFETIYFWPGLKTVERFVRSECFSIIFAYVLTLVVSTLLFCIPKRSLRT